MRTASRSLILIVLALGLAAAAAAAPAQKPADPCRLITQAEVQEAVGKPVGEAKLNSANPLGPMCEYRVGDYGTVSVFLSSGNPPDYADKMKAGLKKQNIAVADVSGVGDKAFFAEPGYGMLQINALKGGNYVLITLLVPGATPEKTKAAAESLMKKALGRI